MILGAQVKAYVCREPVDMRKSIDGLAQLVGPLLGADPLCGSLFVFLSRGRDKVKILWWDRHGFWLAYKRLERGRFPAPETLAREGLSSAELVLWLEGVDLTRTRRLPTVQVTCVA
jgi:transposase